MKIKLDFVANSSSMSSIIIKTKKKLTKELILDKMQVKEGHPLYKIALRIVNIIHQNLINLLPKKENKMNIYENDGVFTSESEFEELLKDLKIKDSEFELIIEGGY